MRVRVEELVRAISRLPDPETYKSDNITMHAAKMARFVRDTPYPTVSTAAAMEITASEYHLLVFWRTKYSSKQGRVWYEWTLEVT